LINRKPRILALFFNDVYILVNNYF